MTASRQSGNVLIWILIAVVMLAAVGIAVMGGSRSSTSMLSGSEATARANQLIAYSNELRGGIKRMGLRGCTEGQYSFANNILTYTNAGAPADQSCHIFQNAGGGLQYIAPTAWLDTSKIGEANYNELLFTSVNCIPGVGTDDGDTNCETGENSLIFYLRYVDYALCTKINQINGIADDVIDTQQGVPGVTKFSGSYATQSAMIGDASAASYSGKQFGCIKEGTNGYSYYAVLLAR